ncbi:MAG: class I SAM-dependent rRNA methyltransferase [Phycisphaerae bacterium]|nr:class I SAM-dependent rRNA methyltransferase [Phycisphaerae bacterium]
MSREPHHVEPPPDARSPWVLLRSASLHPFVYRKMVRSADPAARPGDIVNLYDKSGRYFGRGLYNPRSQIVVRILTHEDIPVDTAFWRARLERAVALRRRLDLDAATDAYRLVHAEGDGLSGLIVERYADSLVFEVFSLAMFQRARELGTLLAEVLGPPTSLDRPDRASPTWRMFLRADPRVERLEGFTVPVHPDLPGGDASTRLTIREHGIRYRVDVKEGHKTGFFCDQRDNRRRLATLCRDAEVLDLCCYTGGFALCAQKLGGARAVTGVDLDEAAIAIARENANLNQTRVDFVYADAFTYVRQMLANQRQFDVVVLDPPKLVTYREEYEDALRKYGDMNALALQVVRPGGVFVTCSCSGLVSRSAFLETVRRAAQRAGRALQLFDQSGAAPDHPMLLDCPESAYLKVLWFRVL